MNTSIKIILVILLLLCLIKMPYGYYQFVRFVSMIAFALLAYDAKQRKNEQAVLIYAALAPLFQPFYKVALGRTLWNIVDVVVALGLFVSIVKQKNSSK